MEWFNDTMLQLMLIFTCGLAMWSKNTAAMIFAFLVLVHDQLLQNYAGDSSLSVKWTYAAAIFSFFSVVGCLYYKNGVLDDTAYYLAGISTVTLGLNIYTLYLLFADDPTEGLNPLFAAINAVALLAIATGGKRDRRRKNIYGNTLAYRLAVKSRRVDDRVVLSEEAGA